MNQKATVSYAGYIPVTSGMPPYKLHKFQEEAIENLGQKALGADDFAGLLVIPTGGGKTLVAVHWLLENVINNNQKVLWIAHRHELLEQVYSTVTRCAHSAVLPKRESFRFRIISGLHDKPVSLKKEDDFVIASKDSLNHGLHYLKHKWLRYSGEVFLVIDEAHHAVAKTYREVIRVVKGTGKRRVKILGLTATPFRTAQNEQGLLGKIFHDNVVYSIDSSRLIGQGILSKPVIEEPKTHIAPAESLTTKDIQTIENLDQLPPKVARQIVKDKKRNKLIVSHYINNNNQQKFGQLLVFAINRIHAVALNKLFNIELN
ncbi:MAG: DEAD/DEAH box helicase, partial [Chloroflexi bacterium]